MTLDEAKSIAQEVIDAEENHLRVSKVIEESGIQEKLKELGCDSVQVLGTHYGHVFRIGYGSTRDTMFIATALLENLPRPLRMMTILAALKASSVDIQEIDLDSEDND